MVEIKNEQHLAALSQRSIFGELCDEKSDEFVQRTLDRLGVGQKARIELPLRDLDNWKEVIELLKGLSNDLTALYLNPDYNDFEKIRAGFNRTRGVQFQLTGLQRASPTTTDYTTSSGKGW
jgi:hypothetical protein